MSLESVYLARHRVFFVCHGRLVLAVGMQRQIAIHVWVGERLHGEPERTVYTTNSGRIWTGSAWRLHALHKLAADIIRQEQEDCST